MIQISNKSKCSGCGACASRCPKHCIQMNADDEGFLYPHIDESICIDCGICEKVCHELCPSNEKKPLSVYGAFNHKIHRRINSSSGGIFIELADWTIKLGGVVFGARFSDDWTVVIDYADSISGVYAFVGSKYMQSSVGNSYVDCERFLEENRIVLFSGTPCQIAGLKHFLRKDYDNLITVDVACHGAPSPMVWLRYLADLQRLSDDLFNNNRNFCKAYMQWRKFKTAICLCDNEISFVSSNVENPFLISMKENLLLRPSCHDCVAGSGRSHSDITLADFWGVKTLFGVSDTFKGYSLISVNTRKGESLLSSCRCNKFTVPFESVAVNFKTGCRPHVARGEFFNLVKEGVSVPDALRKVRTPAINEFKSRPLQFFKTRLMNTIVEWRFWHQHKAMISKLRKEGFAKENLIFISFRDKTFGWEKYSLKLNYKKKI